MKFQLLSPLLHCPVPSQRGKCSTREGSGAQQAWIRQADCLMQRQQNSFHQLPGLKKAWHTFLPNRCGIHWSGSKEKRRWALSLRMIDVSACGGNPLCAICTAPSRRRWGRLRHRAACAPAPRTAPSIPACLGRAGPYCSL